MWDGIRKIGYQNTGGLFKSHREWPAGSTPQLDVGFDPLHQLREIHCAGLPGDFAPVFECDRGWDGADSIPLAQRLVLIRVDFGQSYVRFELCGCLLEKRGHHLAGPTPLCPEVNDHRKVAAREVLSEGLIGEGDRVGREEWMLAPAAHGLVSKARGRDPVRRVAAGTDDDLGGRGHGAAQTKASRAHRLGYQDRFDDTRADNDASTGTMTASGTRIPSDAGAAPGVDAGAAPGRERRPCRRICPYR